MTAVERSLQLAARHMQEVERSIRYYNALNLNQPVNTRKMTAEEYKEAFGEKSESRHKLRLSEENRI